VARKKAPVRRTAPQRPQQSKRSGNPAVRSSRPSGGTGRPSTGGTKASGNKRPLPEGESFFTPHASPLRQQIERLSAPLLVLFHRLPRPVFGALPLLLLVLGAFLPLPFALVCLALALLLLSWLAFLSWPRSTGGQKVMRLVVPGLVVLIAILRIVRG
jgi:hypothetical protein